MKILIVNASDCEGGAARAAYRLHRSLVAQGVTSEMLVQSKASDDITVLGPSTKVQKGWGKVRPTLDSLPVRRYKSRTKTLFSPSWLPMAGLIDRINTSKADIVHLHWITGGMMRIEDVARIEAPVVWSLHDMWAFTGGCHYDEGCGAFKHQCGDCIVLRSGKDKDLSSRVLKRKVLSFRRKKDITVVGLSRWLADEAASSTLFSGRQIVSLPNPINTETYAPFDREKARELLNIPRDKKLILFGAMGATSDPRKGFKELSAALGRITTRDVELIVFGATQAEGGSNFPQKAHYLGSLSDDVTLRALYSACDVMVVPSAQENLSNAIMESLACGTPVVAFDVGGNGDLVEHRKNGYLAQPHSNEDLASGVDWVLQHVAPESLARSSRSKVLQCFESGLVAKQYIDLYRKVLSKE